MKSKKLVKNFELVLGSCLFPIAVTYFIQPAGLNSGGFVGLAQIIAYLLPFKGFDATGLINMCFNIPLFILAFRGVGPKFFWRTLFSVALQSFLMSALPIQSKPIMASALSNALVGAVIAGCGIGFCLRASASAGGLDILGVYLSKIRPDFSVGKLSYILNAFVLSISAILFSLQTALYSLIFIMIAYFVSDKVHIQNISVECVIFTKSPEVKEFIMQKIGRGITAWKGYGAYTGSETEILLTIINQYEVRYVRQYIKEIDPKAFMIVSPAKPVLGNFERRPTE